LSTDRAAWDEAPATTFERPVARKEKTQLGLF
jgi:hypothetical protein